MLAPLIACPNALMLGFPVVPFLHCQNGAAVLGIQCTWVTTDICEYAR